MLLGETYTDFHLLYYLTYQVFRQSPLISLGIVKISVLLSLLQRLIPCPTYGLA